MIESQVREQAQLAYDEKLQRCLSRRPWPRGCRSWYLDGRGRNTTLWPGFCAESRLATARLERGDYRLSPARTR